MNKKVIFWDIDKLEVDVVSKSKYVLLTKGSYKDVDISSFSIKPIIVSYNGSIIIDMENKKYIKKESINKNDINNVLNYFKTHDIKYKPCILDNKLYQIKISSSNYYRMLILPMFIKNKFNKVKTSYNYPIKINKELYENYIISDKISSISNLSLIINYLNISIDNIIELSKIIDNINNHLMEFGYCKDFNIRKEYLNERKTEN